MTSFVVCLCFFFLTNGFVCSDCGVAFCHDSSNYGCPISNKIPEWNELVYRGEWKKAYHSLKSTNNFPEWTSKVCPAPCEGACVLGLIKDPVTIKSIELSIIEKAYEEGYVEPRVPINRTGKRIAIVGSGPAGLAAADQLNQMGHWCTVFERSDRPGGLMQYGVPQPKIEKEKLVQGRINLLKKEGVSIVTGPEGTIGGAKWYMADEVANATPFEKLEKDFDAVLLATGATVPRDLQVPGANLANIFPAMYFLQTSQKALMDSKNLSNNWRKDLKKYKGWIDVKDLNVIIVGSGDTGTDCLSSSVRMQAKSVTVFEVMPQPPSKSDNWPEPPRLFKVDYGHEEAIAAYKTDPRVYSVSISDFIGSDDDKVTGVRTNEILDGKIIPGSSKVWPADVVLLATGYSGPEVIEGTEALLRGNVYDAKYKDHRTSNPKVFAAGDARRGASLVVHAIAEGRWAAASIDQYLATTKD